MNTRSLLVSLAGLILIPLLTSCKDYGPVSITLNSQQSFALKSDGGKWIAFNQGQSIAADVKYEDTWKKIHVWVGGEDIVFKNAKANEGTDSWHAGFGESEQMTSEGKAVSIDFGRKLICNPNCSQSSTQDLIRSCTYYVQRPITSCWQDGHGHTQCETHWESYPMPGRERVEITTTTMNYELWGTINADGAGLLATAYGTKQERQVSERIIWACQ